VSWWPTSRTGIDATSGESRFTNNEALFVGLDAASSTVIP
jgi:hypothetical protein